MPLHALHSCHSPPQPQRRHSSLDWCARRAPIKERRVVRDVKVGHIMPIEPMARKAVIKEPVGFIGHPVLRADLRALWYKNTRNPREVRDSNPGQRLDPPAKDSLLVGDAHTIIAKSDHQAGWAWRVHVNPKLLDVDQDVRRVKSILVHLPPRKISARGTRRRRC